MTVPDTAACLEAVNMLEESTELIDRLWSNAKSFRQGLEQMGFDTGRSETPIVPVMLGDAPLAQKFSQRLFEEGVFAMAIGFPTVPQGKARIRVMNSAAHTPQDIELALETFQEVGEELMVI
jgi:glycine C-acetyltransferase